MQQDIVKDVLKAFDQAGLWEDGLELIGSWCFFMYQKHLGAKGLPLKTIDIDFLIPRPFLSRKSVDLEPVLKSIGFDLCHNTDGSIFFQHPELKLEFLTPETGRGDEHPIRIKQLGLRPMSLRFLNMLFDNPIQIKERGVTINLPNPRDYCLHKLIMGQRRKNEAKRLKDIEHAVYVLPILKLNDVARTVAAYPPKWRKWIKDSLHQAVAHMPEEIPTIDKFLSRLEPRTTQ